MTLENKLGQIVGIDAKAGIIALYDYLGIENGEALAEEMYPEGTYVADRQAQADAEEELANKRAAAMGANQQPGQPTPAKKMDEAARRLLRALQVMENHGAAREAETAAGHR